MLVIAEESTNMHLFMKCFSCFCIMKTHSTVIEKKFCSHESAMNRCHVQRSFTILRLVKKKQKINFR